MLVEELCLAFHEPARKNAKPPGKIVWKLTAEADDVVSKTQWRAITTRCSTRKK
jgi:hypothetical protein